MANSSSNTGTVIAALLVGAAVGYAIAKLTRPDPCHTAGNHAVVVALDGTLDCPEVTLTRRGIVSWFSPPGTTLQITATSGLLTISCTGNVCVSQTPAGPGNVGYAGQLTDGTQPRPINGRIIINK